MSESNKGGRPPLSRKNETLNVIMPSELMQELREMAAWRGATIAGYVRRAIREEVTRDLLKKQQEG